jgi:Mce-associated membrane protein
VEGQRPDSGDLSDVTAEADTVDELVEDISASSEVDLVADAEVPPADDDAAEAPEPGAPQPGVRTWLQRNSRGVIVVSVASFVVAGAFAGAAVQPYLADRATVATKMTIAATAAKAITTLWSYTPEDMDRLSDRSAQYLGGGFEEQYRKYVDAIAATNKQAKVTSSTQVVGAAVESLRDNEATAIVYTNTTSTTPQNNNIPSLKYLSYRLELQREGRDWRVTKMTTVTSLDLTPKLGL